MRAVARASHTAVDGKSYMHAGSWLDYELAARRPPRWHVAQAAGGATVVP